VRKFDGMSWAMNSFASGRELVANERATTSSLASPQLNGILNLSAIPGVSSARARASVAIVDRRLRSACLAIAFEVVPPRGVLLLQRVCGRCNGGEQFSGGGRRREQIPAGRPEVAHADEHLLLPKIEGSHTGLLSHGAAMTRTRAAYHHIEDMFSHRNSLYY